MGRSTTVVFGRKKNLPHRRVPQTWPGLGKGDTRGTFSHELHLLPPPPTSLFLEFIGDPTAPAWKGHLIAVLMFLAACLQTLFEQQHMYRLKVLQMRLRTAITGLVYRKVSPGEAWAFLFSPPCPDGQTNARARKGHIPELLMSSAPESTLIHYFTNSCLHYTLTFLVISGRPCVI